MALSGAADACSAAGAGSTGLQATRAMDTMETASAQYEIRMKLSPESRLYGPTRDDDRLDTRLDSHWRCHSESRARGFAHARLRACGEETQMHTKEVSAF